MIIEISLPAPEGSTFMPDAFAGNIGKTVQFGNGTAVVVDAKVVDDGSAVLVTFDTSAKFRLRT